MDDLASIVVAQSDLRSARSLLYEIFTYTERVMIAKRIGVIFLLEQEYSLYSISQILSVSESTVSRIQHKMSSGEYKKILKTFKRKKYRESVLGTIETFLSFSLPGGPQRHLREKVQKDIESWRHGD